MRDKTWKTLHPTQIALLKACLNTMLTSRTAARTPVCRSNKQLARRPLLPVWCASSQIGYITHILCLEMHATVLPTCLLMLCNLAVLACSAQKQARELEVKVIAWIRTPECSFPCMHTV
jgi:hypothetical protein